MFSDSPVIYKYDKLLNKYVYYPATHIKWRSEGWGNTVVGKHGVNAITDITKHSQAKVCIWGDSYVEAHQVDDDEKMSQILNALLAENKYRNLIAFDVGMSGHEIADYYFDIPRYEKIVPSITAHFIVLTNFNDTLPKTKPTGEERVGVFLENPHRLALRQNFKPKYHRFKYLLYKYSVYFIWEPVRRFLSAEIRFVPGTRQMVSDKKSAKTYPEIREEAWTFLLTKLHFQTRKPIVFVYCPPIPTIIKGQIIHIEPDAELKKDFAKLANVHQIKFIDVSDRFIKSYQDHGSFPRGFSNSRPSEGHFNAVGHKIVAQAIFDFIKDNTDVVHSN